MPNGIGQVHVRAHKGRLWLLGYGQTPRGQKFIRHSASLHVVDAQDSNFQKNLEQAILTMLPEEASNTP